MGGLHEAVTCEAGMKTIGSQIARFTKKCCDEESDCGCSISQSSTLSLHGLENHGRCGVILGGGNPRYSDAITGEKDLPFLLNHLGGQNNTVRTVTTN